MSWSGLAKVLSGLLVAIALLVGGSYVAAQYLISQLTAPPSKPIFPNDKPSSKPPAPDKLTTSPISAAPQPSPSVSSPAQPVESTGYRARITLSSGLNLREGSNRDAVRIGGVGYNEKVIVLEDSPDKEWQKVRVEGSNLEGWVKAGYTERLN